MFEDRLPDFRATIPSLTTVAKDKVGLARKNAALLLAKLAREEGNKEKMRECHSIEVLMSINQAVAKSS